MNFLFFLSLRKILQYQHKHKEWGRVVLCFNINTKWQKMLDEEKANTNRFYLCKTEMFLLEADNERCLKRKKKKKSYELKHFKLYHLVLGFINKK